MYLSFEIFFNLLADMTIKIEQSIKKGDDESFALALQLSNNWIDLLIKGIGYYHRYHRQTLSACVNSAFVVWLLLLVAIIIQEFSSFVSRKQIYRSSTVTILKSRLFLFILFGLVSVSAMLLYMKVKDGSFVMYAFLPLLIGMVALTRIEVILNTIQHALTKLTVERIASVFVFMVGIGVGVEILVNAFFDRKVLSIIAVCLAFVPWIKMVIDNRSYSITQNLVSVLFTSSSLGLGYFPQLPVVHSEENYLLVVLASFLIATCGLVYTFFVKDRNSVIVGLQTAVVIFCAVIKMHSVSSIDDGKGLPLMNKSFSWSVIFVSPLLIFLTDEKSIGRLVSTILSLSATYILTSISYESLFLFVLTIQMLFWVTMEIHVFTPETESKKTTKKECLTLDHIRIAFMFVYFIFVSFFGTGNVASINSFHIASTYCFQTIFNPWIQGMVLSMKVLIPLLMVTVIFRSMHSMTLLPMRGIFLVILFLTDVMAIHFFFWVKDEGSWLEIGQSLSHFVINLVFVIFLLPVYELAYHVTGHVSIETIKPHSS